MELEQKSQSHVFVVCFPGQGHINPMLRLAKRLATEGLLVTFSSTLRIGNDMRKAGSITDDPTPIGDGFIRFEFFDDLYSEAGTKGGDLAFFIQQFELSGRKLLPQLIKQNAEQNRPVSCLISNPFIPWVCDVASELNIPCAILWVQSCSVFSAYYHFYHKLVPFPSETQPDIDVQLPCLPLYKSAEIPSFLHPNDSLLFLGRAILGQFKNLSVPFCILMDTFQELENEIINYMSKLCPIKPIGPLFKNPISSSSSTVRGDCLKAEDCVEWLNTKPQASVVYISFGSVVYLKQEQIDEIAYGLLKSGVFFIWVLKQPREDLGLKQLELPNGFVEKIEGKGKIVQWSPQEEVLCHPSVACFLTHCGWNSSVEALSSGVPVLTFPQWGDQVSNAKVLVEVYGVGVRLSRGAAENRLVSSDEVEKCLVEAMVGPKAVELKKNALKWKKKAEEAVAEGGSSDRNFRSFVDEIRRKSACWS